MGANKSENGAKRTSSASTSSKSGSSKPKAPVESMAKGGKSKRTASAKEPPASNGASGSVRGNGQARDQLISLGKSKGFLTYEDVHDAMPGDDVGADQMDEMLAALDSEQIEVVDDAAHLRVSMRRPPEAHSSRRLSGHAAAMRSQYA